MLGDSEKILLVGEGLVCYLLFSVYLIKRTQR